MQSHNEVWVWAEQRNEKLIRVSLELLSKGAGLAEKLGIKLSTVLIGDKVEPLAEELIAHGADKVYLVEDPRLKLYQSDVYTNTMANLVSRHQPEILLLGATSIGMDLAPRVAAKVRTGLTAHCIDLYIEQIDGKPRLVGVVPGFGGNLMVKIACPRTIPQMATVKPGILEKPPGEEGRKGEIIKVQAEIKEEDFKAQTIEMIEEKPSGIPLEEADVVVAGGWGMQSAGGFQPVEELADILGGSVAGTRPAVDAGWVPEERMIGSSGKTISPRLFISLGASGAMHFTTGFLKSRVVLAIDRNPEAPIFQVCDIGIVGDLGKIVPCLMEELKRVR